MNSINNNLCAICQIDKKEKLVDNMPLSSCDQLYAYAKKHMECKNEQYNILYQVIENCSSGWDIMEMGIKWHTSCRKTLSNQKQLQKVAKKHAAIGGKPLDNLNESPYSSKRIKRSDISKYASHLCFFCQNDTKEEVHEIQTLNRSNQLKNFVDKSHNQVFKINLSVAINHYDALLIDIVYHQSCWTKFLVRENDNNFNTSVDTEENNVVTSTAKVEFIEVISKILKSGKILGMVDIEGIFNRINDKYMSQLPNSRRSIKRLLSLYLPEIEFIPSDNKHKADNVSFPKEKIAAISAAKETQDLDSEMKIIFKCASLIRKEITHAQTFEFEGTLTNVNILQENLKLCQLLKWILIGSDNDKTYITKMAKVDKSVSVIAQTILYECKSTRQIKYVGKFGDYSLFRHSKEYPLQLGVGLYLHQQFRSKELINFFNSFGLSIDYNRILRLETQLGNSILENSITNNCFIPTNLIANNFIYFAADNSDFNEDTPNGKNTLHATAMVVFQTIMDDNVHNPILKCNFKNTARSLSIPSNFNDLNYCHVPANSQPNCNNYSYFKSELQNNIETTKAKNQNLAWYLCNSFCEHEKNKKIPMLSAYNSLTCTDCHKITNIAMMPLLNAPAHEWNTLMTILMQAQHITVKIMGNNHKTIITFDMQLYEKAVKLQMSKKPQLDNFVFRVGELHVVMNALRALGDSIESSGLEDAWVESELYSSTTVNQILQCKNLKRTLNAHMITQTALHILYLPFAIQSEEGIIKNIKINFLKVQTVINSISVSSELNNFKDLKMYNDQLCEEIGTANLTDSLMAFDDNRRSQFPTYAFLRDYMTFFDWINLFIYATRLGIWELHIESLKALVKYFFAYDKQRYARMLPHYLGEMEKLKVTDPDIYQEFCNGNFCVKKTKIPFVSIGPDHAIEQVNKIMKIQGGLKGITQQKSALLRWFLIAPELHRLSEEAKHMLGVKCTTVNKHHLLSDSKTNKFHNNVEKLLNVLRPKNLFDCSEDKLINLITGAIMPEDVIYSVINRDSIGQAMFNKFVENRLVNNTENFWKTMTKAKLKTWKNCYKTEKSQCKSIVLKDDRSLFARLLVVGRSRQEIDLKETIGKYEFSVNPRSLFNIDGSLRLCKTKSKLTHILELSGKTVLSDNTNTVKQYSSSSQAEYKICIVDGMAIMQEMGKPQYIFTASDLCNHFLKIVEQQSTGFQEIHIIFDRYDIVPSLKQQIRDMRVNKSNIISYNISGDVNIEKISLQNLLSSIVTKQNLCNYFASQIIKLKKSSDNVFVTTCKDICLSNRLDFSHLNSNQEEADTRIILHAIDATNRNATHISILCSDTDVLVLALYHFNQLCHNTYLVMGTGSKRRPVYLAQICRSLPSKIIQGLPAFHALTGCDFTGTFFGKSKQSCWKIYLKCSDAILQSFANFGTTYNIFTEDFANLEDFVCKIYAPNSSISMVKDLRWYLFAKHQLTDEKLPPTNTALREMVQRANYICMMWKKCNDPFPNLLSPHGQGWILQHNKYVAIGTTQPAAPQFLIDLVKCSCKTGCISNHCSCRANNLTCTEMCENCDVNCENTIDDINTVETESESDTSDVDVNNIFDE